MTQGEIGSCAKACMAEGNAAVFRNPVPLTIRAAMKKALSSPMQRPFRYRKSAREKCYDSAHYFNYSGCCEAFSTEAQKYCVPSLLLGVP